MNQKPSRRRIILITGMSGAGLSTALKTFEDLGYEAVDNLRLGLVPTLVNDRSAESRALAVAIDTRNAAFSVDDFMRIAGEFAQNPELDVRLVFLECSDETLQRRFTETRRRHPLALDRPVMDGIKREREMLWRLKDEADMSIDTSLMSIHDLRHLIAGQFPLDSAAGLTMTIVSFSYRHGVPREADMVFDVRFLKNPHYDAKLRPLTGQDAAVADYVRRDPGYAGFMKDLAQLILPRLPRYLDEGKSYLTIAIGCTGGKHRSVAVAEELAGILASNDYIVGISHRDMDRQKPEARPQAPEPA